MLLRQQKNCIDCIVYIPEAEHKNISVKSLPLLRVQQSQERKPWKRLPQKQAATEAAATEAAATEAAATETAATEAAATEAAATEAAATEAAATETPATEAANTGAAIKGELSQLNRKKLSFFLQYIKQRKRRKIYVWRRW